MAASPPQLTGRVPAVLSAFLVLALCALLFRPQNRRSEKHAYKTSLGHGLGSCGFAINRFAAPPSPALAQTPLAAAPAGPSSLSLCGLASSSPSGIPGAFAFGVPFGFAFVPLTNRRLTYCAGWPLRPGPPSRPTGWLVVARPLPGSSGPSGTVKRQKEDFDFALLVLTHQHRSLKERSSTEQTGAGWPALLASLKQADAASLTQRVLSLTRRVLFEQERSSTEHEPPPCPLFQHQNNPLAANRWNSLCSPPGNLKASMSV